MFCYAVFYGSKQLRVFAYNSRGDDWKRAEALAVDMARKAKASGYSYTVEHFGVSGVGCVVSTD